MERKRSSEFLRIFAVDVLLFLAPAGGFDPAARPNLLTMRGNH